MKPAERTTLGELIEALYDAFLQAFGDPDLAAQLTAARVEALCQGRREEALA
jgi:hypothetical protein